VIKQILKSKTMLLAILLAVLGVVQASMDIFTPYISPQAMGLLTMLVGVLVAILRVVTTMPLDKK
jgi:hypothetical protein